MYVVCTERKSSSIRERNRSLWVDRVQTETAVTHEIYYTRAACGTHTCSSTRTLRTVSWRCLLSSHSHYVNLRSPSSSSRRRHLPGAIRWCACVCVCCVSLCVSDVRDCISRGALFDVNVLTVVEPSPNVCWLAAVNLFWRTSIKYHSDAATHSSPNAQPAQSFIHT